ncbi:unnamed protein product [Nippostrongylus brasiliensis]|uniref:MSP domain-containing protein n=1 Tax=Nippostrongylus brasiliensis TaxID=27835 RepID=A0A0N4YYN1_NIPBR|nr:unnamed protein product [Nippostrongylus brasiliensis]
MLISVEPSDVTMSASRAESTHRINNDSNQRIMFKMKISNVDDYRVTPVYGFIDPSGSTKVDVIRKNGIPKNDQLVVQFAPAPDDATDAKTAFRNLQHEVPAENSFTINLCAQ